MAKVKQLENRNGWITWAIDCPGCGRLHAIWTGNGPHPIWAFNGDMERPTFSPSLMLKSVGGDHQCHSFIRDGKIEFLSDCSHELAGKTVDLPEIE